MQSVMRSGPAKRWPLPNTSPHRVPPTSFLCPLPWQPLQQQQPIQADGREGRWVKVTTHKEGQHGWTAILQQREPRPATTPHFMNSHRVEVELHNSTFKIKGSTIPIILLNTLSQHVTSTSDRNAPIWMTKLPKDCMTFFFIWMQIDIVF